MEVVILCGGYGTRLREETEFKPKPLIEIGDKPILWHIMKFYHHQGVRDFVLCLGYKGSLIRDYFMQYSKRQFDCRLDMRNDSLEMLNDNERLDWRITFVDTGQESLTGTRIRKALPYIKGDRFFATYGDGVSNVDLQRLLSVHTESGKQATVTAVHPSSRFGELDIRAGALHSFMEKPQTGTGWINGGFFVFEKRAIAHIPEHQNLSLEHDILEPLTQEKQLSVYQHEGFWQCMDTYREMQLLNDLWHSGKAEWNVWKKSSDTLPAVA